MIRSSHSPFNSVRFISVFKKWSYGRDVLYDSFWPVIFHWARCISLSRDQFWGCFYWYFLSKLHKKQVLRLNFLLTYSVINIQIQLPVCYIILNWHNYCRISFSSYLDTSSFQKHMISFIQQYLILRLTLRVPWWVLYIDWDMGVCIYKFIPLI